MENFKDNPVLNAEQKRLLAYLSASPLREIFYLTGGTALAAFHLGHRHSEDLDFFTEQGVPIGQVMAFVQSLPDVARTSYEHKFDRRIFLIEFTHGGTLKVEFTTYPFRRLEMGRTIEGIAIDSLRDILVNKLAAMTERQEAKDYVDIYCAAKLSDKVDLAALAADTESKFGVRGIRHILTGRFLQPLPSAATLRTLKPISDEELRDFFIKTAREWIAQSLEQDEAT